ncbi:hypothetical protein K170097C1_64520 [Hungatella effluvii]
MMVTQLGLSVMVPVFVCILAGSWIDRHAGTNLTIFLMFLGFLAGGWNGYKVAMTTLRMNEQEEKKEDQEARREQMGEPRPPVHKPKQKSRVRRHEDDEKL